MRKQVEETMFRIADVLRTTSKPDVMMEDIIITAYVLFEAKRQNIGLTFDELVDGKLGIPEEIIYATRRILFDHQWSDFQYQDYDLEVLKEIILHTEMYYGGGKFGPEFTTPETLIDLANGILQLKEDDTAADICCGFGSYLLRTADQTPCKNLYGYDINAMAKVVATIRAKVAEKGIHISLCNALSLTLPENSEILPAGRFTRIFSNFPFGLRLRSMLDQPGVKELVKRYIGLAKAGSTDWLYIAAVMELLAEEGRAVCLTTNGSTWNTTDKEIRKYFVEEGFIEAVIALPPKMLASISIPTSLLVLSRKNKAVRMVDATTLYAPGRRYNTLTAEHIDAIVDAYLGDSEYSKQVSMEEIRANDYDLHAERYVAAVEEIENGIPFEKIMLSISRGAPCTAKELDEMSSAIPTDYQYMSLSNIQGGIIDAELPYLKKINPKYANYCVKAGTLILSKIGFPYKVAVTQFENDVLVNGNLYIVELNKEIADPVYVKAFLESTTGQNALKAISVGAVMPNIGVDRLKQLMIPLPDMDEQKRVAKHYRAAQDEVIILKKRLQKAQDKLAHVFDTAKEG